MLRLEIDTFFLEISLRNNFLSQFKYGVIEGFFGETWSWSARQDYVLFLKEQGYSFYIYAPKGDDFLRKNWQQDWPLPVFEELIKLGDLFHQHGLLWGIGFSPYEIYLNYNSEAIAALKKKILYLNNLQPDIFALLFDDMQGDFYQLAQIQSDIMEQVAALSSAGNFIICPTYYSDDPILDKLFGPRPADYLESLGKMLDEKINVFWTGPQVCSKAYPETHLKNIGERLGRKPFLWDNYPVNDGPHMSKFLHLRGFNNRPYQIAELASGHAVNPMNQAYLSQIPLMSLYSLYQLKDKYSPLSALAEATKALCGEEFTTYLLADLQLFQDQGLDNIFKELKIELIKKYQRFQNHQSAEIVRWLNHEYMPDMECLT